MKRKITTLLTLCLLAFSLPLLAANEVTCPSAITVDNGYIGLLSKGNKPLAIYNGTTSPITLLSITGYEGTDFYIDPHFTGNFTIPAGYQVKFDVCYLPTPNGATQANLTIATSAGNFNVALSGKKAVAPEPPVFESFESAPFPALGWNMSEWERNTEDASSGSYSSSPLLWGVRKAYLQTPRLNLSSGKEKLTFDYRETYTATDTDPILSNYQTVEISIDEGAFTEIWNSDQMLLNDAWRRVTLDLSAYTSENALIRFTYYCDNPEIDAAISFTYWDNIILPALYGTQAAPFAASEPVPANGTDGILYGPATLSWRGSLFAEGYKVYLSTNRDDITGRLNPIDAGNRTDYRIENVEPSKTYYWSVVPYNNYGATANTPVWSFSTQDDARVTTFPYEIFFEKAEGFPAKGWSPDGGGVMWKASDIYPYAGKQSAFCRRMATKDDGVSAMLVTPEIVLPATACHAAFAWCNNSPGGANTFATNPTLTERTQENDTLSFEILLPGTDEWLPLAYNISPYTKGNGWEQQFVDLSDYMGKTVKLRWHYRALNAYNALSASVDNFVVDAGVPAGLMLDAGPSLRAYPSLTDGEVRFSQPSSGIILNLQGVRLTTFANTERVDLSSYPAGTYLIQIDRHIFKVYKR